jgi:hypothetical protein
MFSGSPETTAHFFRSGAEKFPDKTAGNRQIGISITAPDL